MKKQQLKSVLGSVLLASMTLVPVASVFAEDGNVAENPGVNSVSVSATTTPMNPAFLRGDLRDANEQGREQIKNLGEQNRENIKNLREKQKEDFKNGTSTRGLGRGERGDFRRGSSTASSTMNNRYEQDQQDRQDNREERRSDNFHRNFASSTANILRISERLGNLGNKIKDVVESQASSTATIAEAVAKEEGRSTFKTFLLGADYKNLGQVISEVAKTQARINQLDSQISNMASSTDKVALVTNVQTLKDQVTSLQQYVNDNQSKFSLFGWFMRRFNQ